MIRRDDFRKKQLVFIFVNNGEKFSISNENIVVKNKDGEVVHKSSCYRLFAIFIIGDTSITTPLIRIAKRFMFNIFLMNTSMKLYQMIGNSMEGNTLLRKKQYNYNKLELGRIIIINKIDNQLDIIKKIRSKDEEIKQNIKDIKRIKRSLLNQTEYNIHNLMGYEGASAKLYFSSIFCDLDWTSRRPRIKVDYINSILDIGYTILFNFIDALLLAYGFDNYYGVLHRTFFNRKSLVCDIVEPIRPLIDYEIRKSINLGIFKKKDFKKIGNRYELDYKNSKKYVKVFAELLYEHKDEIFIYIQNYYRAFMKEITPEMFPKFEVK